MLHLCAPLVMVKPPVSSCWMCMAKSRAAGRVGWALKRRPSIRHRLSLFRKTWCPASGWGGGGGQARGQASCSAGAHSAQPTPGGAPVPRVALASSPPEMHPGLWTGDRKLRCLMLADTQEHRHSSESCTPAVTEMANPFLAYSPWALERSRMTTSQTRRDPHWPAAGTASVWCLPRTHSPPPCRSCVQRGAAWVPAACLRDMPIIINGVSSLRIS